MCKWKQELKELIQRDRQSEEKAKVAIKECLESLGGNKYYEEVVRPAFSEIRKVFTDYKSHVWIDGTSLTIGYGAMVAGKKEYTKEVKYEISILGETMKSKLSLLMNVGPTQEYPVQEHNLVGAETGKNIEGITKKDIIDDFMEGYAQYVAKK